MLVHAVDYACWCMLWITHAGACCGLRMLVHAVDYDASHLWIMGFALWITRAVLAVDFPALWARAHISAPAVLWSSWSGDDCLSLTYLRCSP